MTAWQVYWLLQLDSIGCIFCCIGWLSVIGVAGSGICYFFAKENRWDNKSYGRIPLRIFKRCAWALVIFGGLSTFIPSTKTMAAVYVVPKIIHGDTIESLSKDSADIYKLGINRLKELLEDKKSNPQ